MNCPNPKCDGKGSLSHNRAMLACSSDRCNVHLARLGGAFFRLFIGNLEVPIGEHDNIESAWTAARRMLSLGAFL